MILNRGLYDLLFHRFLKDINAYESDIKIKNKSVLVQVPQNFPSPQKSLDTTELLLDSSFDAIDLYFDEVVAAVNSLREITKNKKRLSHVLTEAKKLDENTLYGFQAMSLKLMISDAQHRFSTEVRSAHETKDHIIWLLTHANNTN